MLSVASVRVTQHGNVDRQSVCFFISGSTDCICFATVGTNDPVTSALHIIIGQSHGFTTQLL